jgi:ELWxxDGT repeat protein
MVPQGSGPARSNPANLTAFNGAVYFTAYTTTNGYQVWQSDGTAAGTVRDTNLNTGATNVPANFAALGTAVYFTAPGATMWQWQTSTPTPTRPTITWSGPANLVYGTALSSTQLDATASVAGTFAYTPTAGTVLKAGNGQTLSVSFTPTDTIDYTTATATVTINVARATPRITWANPANIVYGTALGSAQLNATTSWVVGGTAGAVPGTFTYSHPVGTVLNVGNGQTLSVSFTPTDTTDYTTATATVTINVVPAGTPTLSAIANQTVSTGQSLTLTLQGSDPNGLPLTYSAQVDSLAYHLKSTLGLYKPAAGFYTNVYHGGEQWVQGTGGVWYYILPSGGFYQWSGVSGQLTGTLVAQLDPSYNANPSALVNAQPGQGQATVSLSGSTLTITPNAGFSGLLYVTATVSDGYATASQAFKVTVTS